MKCISVILFFVLSLCLIGCFGEKNQSNGNVQPSSSGVISPYGLTYGTNTFTLGAGLSTTLPTPTFSTDSQVFFSTNPSLPTGISINSSTGVISGTPVNGQSSTMYVVTAVNTAGSSSAIIWITVDSSVPASVAVTDAGYFTTNSTSLSFSWNASSDTESGISKYEYSVGTSTGSTDIVPWTDVGLSLSKSIGSLSLTGGVMYFANIRITNGVGLTSTSSSDGIVVRNFTGVFAQSFDYVGDDGDGTSWYHDKLFFCNTSACQLIDSNATDHSGAQMFRANYAESILRSRSYYDGYTTTSVTDRCTSSGCSSINTSLWQSGAYDLSGTNSWMVSSNIPYRCLQSGDCQALSSYIPVTYLTPMYSQGMYKNPTSSFSFLTPSGVSSTASFTGTYSDHWPYSNNENKVWAIVSRSSVYYLISCSASGCTDVQALTGSSVLSYSSSTNESGTWLTTNTRIYYCLETGCTTLSSGTFSSMYSKVQTQDGNALWIQKSSPATTWYCTKTSCSTIAAYHYLGHSSLDTAWGSNGTNVYQCKAGTCSTIANGPTGSITASQNTSGMWGFLANGVYYCAGSGSCSNIQSFTGLSGVSPIINRQADGIWFQDNSTKNVYYCTSTSCSSLTKPSGFPTVSFK